MSGVHGKAASDSSAELQREMSKREKCRTDSQSIKCKNDLYFRTAREFYEREEFELIWRRTTHNEFDQLVIHSISQSVISSPFYPVSQLYSVSLSS